MSLKAGIVGGAGYTGGELIRILINHPAVTVSFVHSRSQSGKAVHEIHPDLLGETGLKFSANLDHNIDILFLCLGHGESRKFISENKISDKIKIIDLGNDFRLQNSSKTGKRKFIYGLPELNREAIKNADNIANPGCFATTIQLGLLPLAKAGMLKEIYITGITGSTGAGQSLSATSHFSWRANNIQAYKTLTHQHLAEISESLRQLQPKKDTELNFVPWRGDFTRGIFSSAQVRCNKTLNEVYKLYSQYYDSHPFTFITKEPVFLKQVVNTNKCMIQLEQAGSLLVAHAVTDNLLKGASGQAVQNMNLMFGLEETLGLKLKATAF